MLRNIHIRHLAVVDELNLDLQPGMTVLTGETGAGKSILIDALSLALGDRADSGVIRAGQARAEISADFDLDGLTAINDWLNEQELDDDGQCLIRRTISRDAPSRGYINGRLVPMQSLRELGEMLVDIHGQHAHQSLLRRDAQRQALDAYAGHQKLIDGVAGQYRQWHSLRERLDELTTNRSQREDRLELLRYQVQELQELALKEDELTALEEEHDRLANLNQLREGSQQVLQLLIENEDNALADTLERAASDLERLQSFDARLGNIMQTVRDAAIQTSEAGHELRDYLEGLSLDPERLREIDQRLGLIHDLSRKHQVSVAELPALQQQLEDELATLEDADVALDATARELAATETAYRIAANKLQASRRRAAKKLAKAVSDNMHQLGMKEGCFEIALETREHYAAYGLERVEFLVSANPGQPPQPLAKIASGGELARISLAIQVITVGTGSIPTLIFDEVDVGIGGGIAEIVGRLLRNLGHERQVLCVTHQPQVASLAHQHLQVHKQSNKKTTITDVSPLTAEARVDEIARMLGGLEITEQTLSHAREMIERGQRTSV
ncbi:MAG TPA: DNA repair protein RecN [Gammaproteobacteria bacterium]|nr:DNA repair protein RecN [Gammaproteobacteria bacterium]